MHRQLESVVVAFADMTTCRGYCEAFIDEGIASGSHRVRSSCITAIMSTYARPFVETRQPDYLPQAVPSRWLNFEVEGHQVLHEEIIDLRHRYLAHSTRGVRQPNPAEGIYVIRNLIVGADRVPMIRDMADHLACQLEQRRISLHREVFGSATPAPVKVGHTEAGAPIHVEDVFGKTVTIGMTLPSRW